jgi:hypothetical protein
MLLRPVALTGFILGVREESYTFENKCKFGKCVVGRMR